MNNKRHGRLKRHQEIRRMLKPAKRQIRKGIDSLIGIIRHNAEGLQAVNDAVTRAVDVMGFRPKNEGGWNYVELHMTGRKPVKVWL